MDTELLLVEALKVIERLRHEAHCLRWEDRKREMDAVMMESASVRDRIKQALGSMK